MAEGAVADRFELLELAGSGGMGAVYRARDIATDEIVALKVLSSSTPSFVERFAREAHVLANLRHPSIVRYVTHGQNDRGEPFLAMEWLDGHDLETELTRGPLSLSAAVGLGVSVAHALAAAHEQGIVHRDIKPSNVFLEGGEVGRVKVLDFGVARLAGATLARSRTGAALGTPGYMAPEQARGDRELDARADVFSLGAVLFECITGAPAFRGDHVMAVLAKILLEDPPRPSDLSGSIPGALDDLVHAMLAADPAARPASALAVREALAALGTLAAAPAPARADASVLSGGEERIVSILLVATAPDARTTVDAERADRIRRVAAEHGAEAEPLFGGATVVHMLGSARDQALSLARCALALRQAAGDAPMALASARSNVTAGRPMAAAVERAARALGADSALRGIRVDEVTRGLLDARFDVRDEGGAFLLAGEHRVLEPVRKLLGRPTSFVGRARELAALEGAWAECLEERVPAVLLVTAQAGIGKSRLRYELVRRAQELAPEAQIWIARGDPSSAGSALGMIARATRAALGLHDSDSVEARHRKIGGRARRLFGEADAASIERFIAELCAAPFDDPHDVQLRAARADPVLMGDRVRAAWERWALAECERAPVLLVLEDLHWGDAPSIRLVDSLLGRSDGRPFMVLALGRPEVTSLFPQLFADRALVHIRLRTLSAKASEQLVREALGEAAEEGVVAHLVALADGNAFFLEELIRAVAEGRESDLPETVLAVMQQRLERLDPEARRTLRAGAVFGDVFFERGVEALCSGARKAWIDELVSRELVTPRPSARFAGETEYVFRHALVQETAYAMLIDADRRAGHRMAGEWLESVGEQDADVLARHFERGGSPERAFVHYLAAARAAFRANDLEGAVARCEAAEACGPEPRDRAELAGLRATVERWRADFAAAATAAQRALALGQPGSASWLVAAADAAHALGKLARKTEVLEVAETVRGTDTLPGAAGQLAVAFSEAAMQCYFVGEYDRADALLDEVDRFEREGALEDPGLRAITLRARAYRAWFHRDLAGTMERIEASARAFETAGDRRNACTQHAALGYIAMELGLDEDAERALQDAIATAEGMGLSGVAANARQNLAFVLARRGRLDEALRAVDRSIAELDLQGDRRLAAASRIYRAQILAKSGRLEEADEEAARALEHSKETPQARTNALATASRIALVRGDVARASAWAEEAVERLESVSGIGEGEAQVWLAAAEARRAQGDADRARVAIERGSAAVRERASMISDEAKRAAFVKVEDNARLLELAEG